MAASTTEQVFERSVVVVGKCGAGKSSVANKLLGENTFKVAASLDGVTEVISHGVTTFSHNGKKYRLKVVDTVGLFDQRYQNKDTVANIQQYFRETFPDGISLVLVVFSKSRFTEEEQKCLETIVKIFRKEISPLAALVITHCDHMKPESRHKYVEEFRSNQLTSGIATFMEKGILTVGFPNPEETDADEYALAEKKMSPEIDALRDLVCACGEMRLGKQLCQDPWWEEQRKNKACAIL